ncbi:hypothetical protein G5B35_14965 [Parapusillimonas sp. SGNA-6]|nr:hypothetical protein [Parapusillimonas sp. SGNA-6]
MTPHTRLIGKDLSKRAMRSAFAAGRQASGPCIDEHEKGVAPATLGNDIPVRVA